MRYRQYYAFLTPFESIGIFLNTERTALLENTMLVEGAAIFFPSMSAKDALLQEITIEKNRNGKTIENDMPLCKYLASFQGRAHNTLRTAIVSYSSKKRTVKLRRRQFRD